MLKTQTEKVSQRLMNNLAQLISSIYPDHDTAALSQEVIDRFWRDGQRPRMRGRIAGNAQWSEKDNYLIAYGNTIVDGEHKPLDLLRDFAEQHLEGTINGIHILPFFPFTSDDGFAVTDYRQVNSELGAWEDITRISEHFRLMSDLVLNHGSSQSVWFNEYLQGHPPYDKYFFEASPDDDLSDVVRPRAHPLLREVETANGTKYVWCTFSHDQVDFDFRNPEVLLEFLEILRFHIDMGVRTVRLDAVAFVWKQAGTSSIHLKQTHDIVKVMRLLCDYCEERVLLITETNVPRAENLSYFGNRNEAHMVYNFSLPPLVLHALLKGTSKYLKAWQMSMPPAQLGCTYFNFTASHDGIGLRPAEGIIPNDQLTEMLNTVQNYGARISMRETKDGPKPYELNVALYDAFKGTVDGVDEFQAERFICSQTIAMGLEGIPAFYLHSLVAAGNDTEGVERLGYNRAINRTRFNYTDLRKVLEDENEPRALVFKELKRRIRVRSKQPAFHPNATQFTLHLGDEIFGFWRQSLDRAQSIFAISNLTKNEIALPAVSLNLIDGNDWIDLLTGDPIESLEGDLTLAPYQTMWITNRMPN
ncbi:sugar phosphorylase [Ahrensia marina]|uniref:Alpha-amylase n=1 Tax=Ahrensia marina TaxID=1514904 RepID=A0A0M9GMW0_9HYPH|nr:sugar phosphorylase [Ahrensia marina]KPB01229.1 alpha-amylase [Ahrensia marina]